MKGLSKLSKALSSRKFPWAPQPTFCLWEFLPATVAYFEYLLFLRLGQPDIGSGRTGGQNASPGEHEKSQGREESDDDAVPEALDATQGMYFFFSHLKIQIFQTDTLENCAVKFLIKGIDQWEKRWVESGSIR